MLVRALSACGKLLGFGRSSSAGEEDRRRWGRVVCDVEMTCWPTAGGPDERLVVRVRNVSPGGINFQASRELVPGELLSVSLPGEEDAAEVLACVVRCDAAADGWHLGCTFATPLGDDELSRFRAARPAARQ